MLCSRCNYTKSNGLRKSRRFPPRIPTTLQAETSYNISAYRFLACLVVTLHAYQNPAQSTIPDFPPFVALDWSKSQFQNERGACRIQFQQHSKFSHPKSIQAARLLIACKSQAHNSAFRAVAAYIHHMLDSQIPQHQRTPVGHHHTTQSSPCSSSSIFFY